MGGSNSKGKRKWKTRPNITSDSDFRFKTLGIYQSGKSSLIYRLVFGEPPKDPKAYLAMDHHELDQDGMKIQAMDYTGRGHYGYLTRLEYIGASGVIFMIDSASPEYYDPACEYLNLILEDENIVNLTLMVVANKQDLNDAVGPEVIEKLIKKNCKVDSIKRSSGITMFVMPMSTTAQDDHSLQLAFRLFVKTMKRKRQEGKVPTGLIPHAWETAEKMAEDSDIEDDDTKVADKDDVINAKEKEANLAFTIGEKEISCFKDPVHIFKSILNH